MNPTRRPYMVIRVDLTPWAIKCKTPVTEHDIALYLCTHGMKIDPLLLTWDGLLSHYRDPHSQHWIFEQRLYKERQPAAEEA